MVSSVLRDRDEALKSARFTERDEIANRSVHRRMIKVVAFAVQNSDVINAQLCALPSSCLIVTNVVVLTGDNAYALWAAPAVFHQSRFLSLSVEEGGSITSSQDRPHDPSREIKAEHLFPKAPHQSAREATDKPRMS